jgi:hypothetical protein
MNLQKSLKITISLFDLGPVHLMETFKRHILPIFCETVLEEEMPVKHTGLFD